MDVEKHDAIPKVIIVHMAIGNTEVFHSHVTG